MQFTTVPLLKSFSECFLLLLYSGSLKNTLWIMLSMVFSILVILSFL